MSQAAKCGLIRQLYPSQFKLNEIASHLASAFILFTALYYIVNVYGCFHQFFTAPPNQPRRRKHNRPDLNIAPLSTLLAAAAGTVIIFATWPQPLEGAALLVMVLAQVSALGWQDHDPETLWKDLIEKLPDVLGVVAVAYALSDGRKRYLELSGNEFYFYHDPQNQVIFAYALTGACALIGVSQDIMIALFAEGPARKQTILMCCSFLMFVCQLIILPIAIGFGATTIPDGCTVFNVTKFAAIITLFIGIFYSFILWILRVRLLPVV